MKIATGAFLALALLTSGAALATRPEVEQAVMPEDMPAALHEGLPAAQAKPAGTSERYRLVGESSSCTIYRGPLLGEGLNDLVIPAECNDLMPGLSALRFWKEGGDGSVAFSSNGSDTPLLFSVADGAAYESYKPSRPLLSIVEAN
jgi:hypothetical protein